MVIGHLSYARDFFFSACMSLWLMKEIWNWRTSVGHSTWGLLSVYNNIRSIISIKWHEVCCDHFVLIYVTEVSLSLRSCLVQWKSGLARKVTSLERDKLVVFYYLIASEIWMMRSIKDLWWECLLRRGPLYELFTFCPSSLILLNHLKLNLPDRPLQCF